MRLNRLIVYLLGIFFSISISYFQTAGATVDSIYFDQASSSRPIITLYKKGDKSIQVPEGTGDFFKARGESTGPLDDYEATAVVSLRSEKRPILTHTLDFYLQHPVATPLIEGWHHEGAEFGWHGDMNVGEKHLSLPLVSESRNTSSKLEYFNEFWLDYTPLPGVAMCSPQVRFEARPPFESNAGSPHAIVAVSVPELKSLELLRTVDVKHAYWKEKDYRYLLGRMLGSVHDEDWRYVKKGEHTVIQRRFIEQLDGVEFLDIVINPGTIIKGVNLIVGLDEVHGAGEVIKADYTRDVKLSDAGHVLRLPIRDALHRHFHDELTKDNEQSRRNFYLREIIIFISDDTEELLRSKPVQTLVFWGTDNFDKSPAVGAYSQVISLKSNTLRVGANIQRLVINMGKHLEQGDKDLRGAELVLTAPYKAEKCAIRIERMQAVSSYVGSVPKFAAEIHDFNQRLSGAPGLSLLKHGEVEGVRFLGYFPFFPLNSSVSEGSLQSDKVQESVVSRMNNLLPLNLEQRFFLLSPSNVLGVIGREFAADKLKLVSPDGLTLRRVLGVHGINTQIQSFSAGNNVSEVEISWPIIADVSDTSYFYLGVGKGGEQLSGVSLFLHLSDGGVVQRRVLPNQPIRLLAGKVKVTSIRLRIPLVFVFKGLELRDMAIFELMAMNYAQAFNAPLPTLVSVSPEPVFYSAHGSTADFRQGRIPDQLSSQPLRFSTPLNPALDGVHGLRLRLSHSHVGVLSLSLRFNWANGITERDIFLNQRTGAVFIPMAHLVGVSESPPNLGALRSIDWVLRSSTDLDGGMNETFGLQFSIDGWAMVSAADNLRQLPLFPFGGYHMLLDHQRAGAVHYVSNRLRLSVKDTALPLTLAARSIIQPQESRLFNIEQVVLEPRMQTSFEFLIEKTETPGHTEMPLWPKWLTWFGIVLIAWSVWKRDWWLPAKLLNQAKPSINLTASRLRRAWGGLGQFGYPMLPVINRAIYRLAPRLPALNSLSRQYIFNYPNYVTFYGWLVFTLALYGIGLLGKVSGGADYLFSIGALALVFTLRAWLMLVEPYFRGLFPTAAECAYAGKGKIYFTMALIKIFATVLVLTVDLKLIAEQLATAAFYCLLLGAVQTAWVLYKGTKNEVNVSCRK